MDAEVPSAPPDPTAGELPFRVIDACNAHCAHCHEHRPGQDQDLDSEGPLRRLSAALDAFRQRHGRAPRRLALGGGEPTLYRRLPALIRLACSAGVAEVWLETNGFALTRGACEQLRRAGLHGVRVGIGGGDETAVADRMRRPQALALAWAGAEAAAACGVRVELAVVALREVIAELDALVARAIALGAVDALIVHPYRSADTANRPIRGPIPSTDALAPAALHPMPRDLEPGLQRAAAALQTAGIALRADPSRGFHPCAFERPRPLAGLLRGGRVGDGTRFVQLPGCSACALRERCDGVERSLATTLGEAVITPLTDERRALWAGVQERTRHGARTDRVDVRDGSATTARRREHVLRINHACNQRCRFCWVDFEAGEMTAAAVVAAIASALAASPDPSAETITFTGGEPTLRADLPALVAAARDAGAGRVQLQTNAVRLAEGDLAQRLQAAGLTEALVSLHGHDAATSDAITGAPGTYARTLAGVKALLAAGVGVVVNHVLNPVNVASLPDFIDLCADRFAPAPGQEGIRLTLAVASAIDRGPLDPDVLPTQSAVAPGVRAGLARARERGVAVLDVAHPCGFALCVLDPDLAVLDPRALRQVPTAGRLGEAEGCVKPAAICGHCALEPRCFGLRAEYAVEHGIGELRAQPQAVAVIGLGRMGLRHLRAAEALGLRPLAVVRDASDRKRLPAGIFAVDAEPAATLPEALRAAGVGLVVVAVPTDKHVAVAAPLLAAGLRVLVEKPLAVDAAAAVAMVAHVPDAKTLLRVAHTSGFDQATRAAFDAWLAALKRERAAMGGAWHIEIDRAEPGRPVAKEAQAAALVDVLVHDLAVVWAWAQTLSGPSPSTDMQTPPPWATEGPAFSVLRAGWSADGQTLQAELEILGGRLWLQLQPHAQASARTLRLRSGALEATCRLAAGEAIASLRAQPDGPARLLPLPALGADAALLQAALDDEADGAALLSAEAALMALRMAEALIAQAGVGDRSVPSASADLGGGG